MKKVLVSVVIALVAIASLTVVFARSSWLEVKSYQLRPSVIEKADAIVVLGAAVWPGERPSPALGNRTREAVELYRAGYAPLIICTGGVGTYPPSEGRVAARYAAELGVPEGAIRFEEQSTSTWSNAQGAWDAGQKEDIKRVIVVSDGFHLARAKRIFADVGFEHVQVVPVPDSPFTPEQWTGFELRETLALIAYRLGIRTL